MFDIDRLLDGLSDLRARRREGWDGEWVSVALYGNLKDVTIYSGEGSTKTYVAQVTSIDLAGREKVHRGLIETDDVEAVIECVRRFYARGQGAKGKG